MKLSLLVSITCLKLFSVFFLFNSICPVLSTDTWPHRIDSGWAPLAWWSVSCRTCSGTTRIILKKAGKEVEWNSVRTELLYVTVDVCVDFLVLLKWVFSLRNVKWNFIVTSLCCYLKIFSSLNKKFYYKRYGSRQAFF